MTRRMALAGILVAVIVGDNEAQAHDLTLKSLRGETPQSRVKLDEAVALVRARE